MPGAHMAKAFDGLHHIGQLYGLVPIGASQALRQRLHQGDVVVTQRALDAMEASGDAAIAPAPKLLLDRYRFELIVDAGPLRAFKLTRK